MIRNFIYLDELKLFSLSSQIFEGVTEQITKETSHETSNKEEQKGPIASGKFFADIIQSNSKSLETKILHDHAYSLFEKHLIENELVYSIDRTTITSEISAERILSTPFVKVTAKATFFDTKKITETFAQFNEFGKSVAYIQSYEEIEKLVNLAESAKSEAKDKALRRQIDQKIKDAKDTTKLARVLGFYYDDIFLKSLAYVTKYGFADQFDAILELDELQFSFPLKREYLRENEDLLVRKYARKTERELTILGVACQTTDSVHTQPTDKTNFPTIKDAIYNCINHISNMENKISGKRQLETVIDPIAAYF